MPMVTDTRRMRRTDPGEPNDCPVFTLHRAFVPKDSAGDDGRRLPDGRHRLPATARRSSSSTCSESPGAHLGKPAGLSRRTRARVWAILEDGNGKARARRPPDDGRGPRRPGLLTHGPARDRTRSRPGRLPGQARRLRGPPRPAPLPDPQEEDRDPGHPDRGHHPRVPRLSRPEGADQPRPRGRVPAHGRLLIHIKSQMLLPREQAGRARHRPAPRARRPARRLPEDQGPRRRPPGEGGGESARSGSGRP